MENNETKQSKHFTSITVIGWMIAITIFAGIILSVFFAPRDYYIGAIP